MSKQWGTIEERLWGKVDKSGGPDSCWLWTGSTHSGYGQIMYKGKTCSTHRVAYELEYGEIPEGKHVCHNCPGNNDNPLCCNPKHMWLGTHKENMHDRDRKGHNRGFPFIQGRGETKILAKLTEPQVIKIRELAAQGYKFKTLAEMFKVSSPTISMIVRRKNWRHVA